MGIHKRQIPAKDHIVNGRTSLVIVPCGSRKIWHSSPQAGQIAAKKAYTSQLFKAHRDYAQMFGTQWRILSAKYGILHPDQLIGNYDCKFDASYLDIKNWWKLETMVLQARALRSCDQLVLLGGTLYRAIMRKVFMGIYLPSQVFEPFAGCDLPTTIRNIRRTLRRTK